MRFLQIEEGLTYLALQRMLLKRLGRRRVGVTRAIAAPATTSLTPDGQKQLNIEISSLSALWGTINRVIQTA